MTLVADLPRFRVSVRLEGVVVELGTVFRAVDGADLRARFAGFAKAPEVVEVREVETVAGRQTK